MDLTRDVFENALQVGQKKGVVLKLPHLVGEDPAGQQAHKICYTGWRDFFLGSDGFVCPCMSTSEKLFLIGKYSTFEEIWNVVIPFAQPNISENQWGLAGLSECTNCLEFKCIKE